MKTQIVAYTTIVSKEWYRIVRIWPQTIIPPIISTTLYFLIFGKIIGSQVQIMAGVPYMVFIAPGLILMSVMTNAFSNVVFSFYFAKFQKNLEEILVAPVHPLTIVLGFITGGIIRALIIAIISIIVILFFIPTTFAHIGILLSFIIGTAFLFSLGGLLNAIYATKMDDLSVFTTFILTPLTYFGGVFYSIQSLPPLWQTLSHYNPILYLINGFRYGFLGVSDTSLLASYGVLFGLSLILIIWIYVLFKKGRGLKL